MHSFEELRGVHEGRSALVMGSGPSLLGVTADMVKRHVSIAVNEAIAKFPDADYYSTGDPQMIGKRHWKVVQQSSCRMLVTIGIFNNDWLSDLGPDPKRGDVDSDRVYQFPGRDPQKRTWNMSRSDSKIMIASSAQMAVHKAVILGCDPIYIAGCDCKIVDGKRYYWQFPGETFRGGWNHLPEEQELNARESGDSELEGALIDIWRWMREKCSCARLISVSGGNLHRSLKQEKTEVL